MNTNTTTTNSQSGGVTFLIDQGKIHCGELEARLTPINMKVLQTLLLSEGGVVSRGEIFDSVWGEQQVSDDSLTRSISDIRQQLKKIMPDKVFIETIPKRGYRWKQVVELLTNEQSLDAPDKLCTNSDNAVAKEAAIDETKLNQQGSQLFNIKLILLGTLITFGLFVGLFSTINYMLRPQNILILLPTQTEPRFEELAVTLEEVVSRKILRSKDFKLLTQRVLRPGSSNHFQYLTSEYRARYAIEGLVRQQGDTTKIVLNLVDARTAIILESQSITSGEVPLDEFVRQFLSLLENENL
jgi:DNA-binding winged helix-turn-helix (wHTH) protein